MPKPDGNPMQSALAATRCTAASKRSGKQCRAPAVRGWTVCRMHGAGGGASEGEQNPNWKHGGRSRQVKEIRALVSALRRQGREMVENMRRED